RWGRCAGTWSRRGSAARASTPRASPTRSRRSPGRATFRGRSSSASGPTARPTSAWRPSRDSASPRPTRGRCEAAMNANARVLPPLFADLDRLDFAAVAAHCADDCVYEDVPFAEATVVGPEAIRAKLALGLETLERIPTTIHELVEDGDTILVER